MSYFMHPMFGGNPSWDFDRLIDTFFYSWPTETKPPSTVEVLKDEEGGYTGLNLQLALAGFDKKDIEVWHKKGVLHISGDNTSNKNVAEKFKSKFNFSYPVSESLDLENATVEFSSGILSIKLLPLEPDKSKSYLFGGT